MTLKYLGERGSELDPRLHRALAVSVPCDLASSSRRLESWFNRRVYMRRFIRSLLAKLDVKRRHFPDLPRLRRGETIETFQQFDDRFTAPLHGFRDARDYWARASSRPFLSAIKRPSLMIQAANDPFLGEACFPYAEANQSEAFHLEVTSQGGHVGFSPAFGEGFWLPRRVVQFLDE